MILSKKAQHALTDRKLLFDLCTLLGGIQEQTIKKSLATNTNNGMLASWESITFLSKRTGISPEQLLTKCDKKQASQRKSVST